MWADISQHTVGAVTITQDEETTEYSGFIPNQMRSSHLGTLDLNESFHCSASQASLNLQTWAQDSSFADDD